MSVKILSNITSAQSKGAALFLQLGVRAFVWSPKWAKHREVAYIHSEIDTPFERLRIGLYGKQKKNSRRYKKITFGVKSNQKSGNSYRDRWIDKLRNSINE